MYYVNFNIVIEWQGSCDRKYKLLCEDRGYTCDAIIRDLLQCVSFKVIKWKQVSVSQQLQNNLLWEYDTEITLKNPITLKHTLLKSFIKDDQQWKFLLIILKLSAFVIQEC